MAIRFKHSIFAVMFLLSVPVSPVFSLLVDDISTTTNQADWYYGDGDYFQTNSVGTSSAASFSFLGLSTFDSAEADYGVFFGGTLGTTQTALVEDRSSSGGVAEGDFASGITLTITGDLYRSSDFALISTGTLLVGQSLDILTLAEAGGASNPVRGQAHFIATGGALYEGNNADNLVVNNFVCHFTFNSPSPAVTDFDTFGNPPNPDEYSASSVDVQITAPEPGTVMLLGLGGLFLARRKKR